MPGFILGAQSCAASVLLMSLQATSPLSLLQGVLVLRCLQVYLVRLKWEPHRSPRRATETPHRLLAAPLVVYDFRPILHQNGRSRENPFGTFEVRYHGSPGGFRPLVLAPQHYKVMLHWDGRGRRSDPGRAHELVLRRRAPRRPRPRSRIARRGGAAMFGRCESSPCVFEFNGNFLQGARCKMREGRQRTLTEGLSAGRAPARAKRSS